MLLLANVDDVSGEVIPHAIEGLMARGANSVHVVQAITKKGRLEYLFFVDANSEDVKILAAYLASEMGTLGVRVFDPQHIYFEYRLRQVGLIAQMGGEPVRVSVRAKEILDEEGQVISTKAEYEDLRLALAQFERAGLQISFADLKRFVEQAAAGQGNRTLRGIQVEHPMTRVSD